MRIKSLLISVCLLANIGNTVFAQFFNPLTIRRGGGGNTISNIGNFGSYVYVTNLGVFTDGGTPLTVGGIGGAGGYAVDTSGNLQFYGNSTFTSQTTNNFAGRVLLTNMNNAISGDGAGLTNISIPNNNIGIRLLWSSPTNIYIPKMYPADGVTTLSFTNNGLVNMATQWFSFTIPPLLGSNSQLVFSALRQTTNANQFNGNMAIYIGPNTNYIGYFQPFPTSSSLAQNFNFTSVLANCGSFTNQITIALSPASSGITNYFDSTVSNTVYVGFFLNGVTGYRSNDVLIGFCAQEVFRP